MQFRFLLQLIHILLSNSYSFIQFTFFCLILILLPIHILLSPSHSIFIYGRKPLFRYTLSLLKKSLCIQDSENFHFFLLLITEVISNINTPTHTINHFKVSIISNWFLTAFTPYIAFSLHICVNQFHKPR